jgi:hypothetical protein
LVCVLKVVPGKGFMSIEFVRELVDQDAVVRNIPIAWKDKQVYRKYYAFWRADAVKNYMENFAALLKKHFLVEPIDEEI